MPNAQQGPYLKLRLDWSESFFSMMPMILNLPPEILDLVIDAIPQISGTPVADLKATCLTSKDFVAACQKRLFRAVELHRTGSEEPGHYAMGEQEERERRTRLLARSLCSNPLLGIYVQSVTYHFIQPIDADEDGYSDVIAALRTMVGVVEMALIFRPWRGFARNLYPRTFGLYECPRDWQDAVVGLLRSPGIRVLTLEGLKDFPGELLRERYPLQHPTLQSMMFKAASGTSFPRPEAVTMGHKTRALESLTCDFQSLETWLESDAATPESAQLDASLVQSINVVNIDRADGKPKALSPQFLRTTNSLRSLSLQVEARHWHLPSPLLLLPHFRLGRLRFLSYEVVDRYRNKKADLYHSFVGLCHPDALPQCTSLENFRLRIRHDIMSMTLGNSVPGLSSWKMLDATLGDGRFTQLKKVEIEVCTELFRDRVEENEAVGNFKEALLEVFDAGLGKRSRECGGMLDIAISVKRTIMG